MQNSYIVDVFLSGVLWVMTTYLFFDIKARILDIEKVMVAHTLTIAMSEAFKVATVIATPFCVFYIFLLWRFYRLMVVSQSWGAGGMGLLTIFLLIGIPMIWLQIMLICVRRGRIARSSEKIREKIATGENSDQW